MAFSLKEIYELRRHMKAFLAQLDRALVELHLASAQQRERKVNLANPSVKS